MFKSTNKFSKTFILSLGGSLINPRGKVDVSFLIRFRNFLLEQVRTGHRFIIVCGGGYPARDYQKAGSLITKLSQSELDWIGIAATRLNAILIKSIFHNLAHPEIIIDPETNLSSNNLIIVGAGWKPGFSTDYDTVLLAQKFDSKTVVNLTNIDCVYSRDPKIFKDAKPLNNLSWTDYRKMAGSKWTPGMNLPFDPVASKLAQKLGLKVVILNGRRLSNLKKMFNNDRFKGTVIGN